jgi:hypothetical protein
MSLLHHIIPLLVVVVVLSTNINSSFQHNVGGGGSRCRYSCFVSDVIVARGSGSISLHPQSFRMRPVLLQLSSFRGRSDDDNDDDNEGDAPPIIRSTPQEFLRKMQHPQENGGDDINVYVMNQYCHRHHQCQITAAVDPLALAVAVAVAVADHLLLRLLRGIILAIMVIILLLPSWVQKRKIGQYIHVPTVSRSIHSG